MTNKEILSKFRALVNKSSSEEATFEAVDFWYEAVDSLFLAGKFDQCDSLLRTVDLDGLNDTLLLAIVSGTAPGKHKLPYRKEICSEVEKRLQVKKIDSQCGASSFLVGLYCRVF